MRHHYVREEGNTSGDHFAVGNTSDGRVLVQLQHEGQQVRLDISPEDALFMALEIIRKRDIAIQRAAEYPVLVQTYLEKQALLENKSETS